MGFVRISQIYKQFVWVSGRSRGLQEELDQRFLDPPEHAIVAKITGFMGTQHLLEVEIILHAAAPNTQFCWKSETKEKACYGST